jgi:hypothetical protein
MKVSNLGEVIVICSFSLSILIITFISGCSTSTVVDEQKSSSNKLGMDSEEKIVIMGRRHGNSYETEPSFIGCIGNNISRFKNLNVVREKIFLDTFYPWFEPRIAPLNLNRMQVILNSNIIAKKIRELKVRYIVWVDGSTETSEENGSMTCGMAPSGGCFGFKSWDKTSSYEATIWDLRGLTEKGKIKIESKGSSYLLGVGPPIPLIARVQGVACKGVSDRLTGFFDNG